MIDPVHPLPLLALAVGFLGLVAALAFHRMVQPASPGGARIQEFAAEIGHGAMTFLRGQYTWLAVLAAVIAGLITLLLPWEPWTPAAYLFGVVVTAVASHAGVRIATGANGRTAEAARVGGAQAGLRIAFRAAASVGFAVSGCGLLLVAIAFFVLSQWWGAEAWPHALVAVCLGASTTSLFARVGGGIFTKAADVGADLVGKVEEGLPEDDPRNPAVIADHVGDNVGAVAAVGTDLLESYIGSLVAPVALAAIVFASRSYLIPAMMLPLGVGIAGIVSALAATSLVRFRGDNFVAALRRGSLVATVIAAPATFGVVWWLMAGIDGVANPVGLWLAVVVGLTIGLAVGQITAWFTSDNYRAVKEVARQSQTGAATVIISGMAEGIRSAAYSVLAVATGVLLAFVAGDWALGSGGGIYGVTLAAIGLLSTLGMTVALSAYAPIADNAAGIVEMAGFHDEAHHATDILDAVGNATGAVARGFTIVSAAVTTLAVLAAFTRVVGINSIDLTSPVTAVGLILGTIVPFLFTSLTLNAVGRAASRMIDEVRRQFREIPGLRAGAETAAPDYGACVQIATAGSLREMVLPGTLAVAAPLVIGFIDVEALAGFLAGSMICGFLLATFMVNAGGAWDSAKRLIEAGAFGGRGSQAHEAVVVGDGVGDSFKDTSGPALNVLVKLMTIVALVFSPAFVG